MPFTKANGSRIWIQCDYCQEFCLCDEMREQDDTSMACPGCHNRCKPKGTNYEPYHERFAIEIATIDNNKHLVYIPEREYDEDCWWTDHPFPLNQADSKLELFDKIIGAAVLINPSCIVSVTEVGVVKYRYEVSKALDENAEKAESEIPKGAIEPEGG